MHSAERREPSSAGSGVALTTSRMFLGVSRYSIESPRHLKMQERSYDVCVRGGVTRGANTSLAEANLDKQSHDDSCEQEVRPSDISIQSSLLNLTIYGWAPRPVSEGRVHRNFDQILAISVSVNSTSRTYTPKPTFKMRELEWRGLQGIL